MIIETGNGVITGVAAMVVMGAGMVAGTGLGTTIVGGLIMMHQASRADWDGVKGGAVVAKVGAVTVIAGVVVVAVVSVVFGTSP